MKRKYFLFLNIKSGTVQSLGVTGDTLRELFAKHNLDVHVDDDPVASFDERLQRAIESDADTIIAAGGDGTATAVAPAVLKSGKTMAFMPLGTANMLARDMGLPLDMEEWASALPFMRPEIIDICSVNGEYYLHKVVIGLVPELAAGREYVRGTGVLAKLGLIRYFLRRIARTRRRALQITFDDKDTVIVRVQTIAVASNAYDEGAGRFFARERLDRGVLTIYEAKHLTTWDILRLSSGMIIGSWQGDEALTIRTAKRVEIRSKKPRLQAMIDGEVKSFAVPLSFEIHPKALTLLAPAQATNDMPDSAQ